MARSALALSLFVMSILVAGDASAAERKVVVARPGVAPGTTDVQKKKIRDGMYRGLTAAKAYGVDEGDLGSALKDAGVSSLASKAASLKVAKAVSAYAVLRYQAKPMGGKVKVRVTVVTTHDEQLAFRDRVVAEGDLEATVLAITKELMSAGASASAGAGSQPAGGGAGRDGPSPLARRLFHQLNPHAVSGFVVEGRLGFAAPLGDDADFAGLGFATGAMVGYQIRLGNFQSVTPGAIFGLSFHGYDDQALAGVNASDGTYTQLSGLVGARYTLHLASFAAWAGTYLGFGWVQESLSNSTDERSTSSGGFAFSFQFGGHYMIVERFGVGLLFDITKRFVGELNGVEYGASTFGMGLSARLKL